MRITKYLPVLAAVSVLVFGALTVQADTKATGLINIETRQVELENDIIKAGAVLQVNVGKGTTPGGFRFYTLPSEVGSTRFVKECVNPTTPQTITAPITSQVNRFYFTDEIRSCQVIQWRFAGWSEDNFAQFYGEWARLPYKDMYPEDPDEARKGHDSHSYGPWYVTKPSTMKDAGVMQHACTRWFCNHTEDAVLDYSCFNKDCVRQIRFAPDNATIVVANPTYRVLTPEIVEALTKRPDVKFYMQ